MDYTHAPESAQPRKQRRSALLRWLPFFILIDVLLVVGFVVYVLSWAPANFPTNTAITIPPGSSARDVAEILAAENVVRSADLFYAVVVYQHDPTALKASTYTFDESLDVFRVATRLTEGEFNNTLLRITFPEGFSVRDFDTFLPESFTTSEPLSITEYEGTLFPDTYFVPPSYTQDELVALLQATADEVLAEERARASSSLSESEIIILASLLEREANDEVSMGLVSGILHNRLDIGMALQVDASVAYGLNKSGTLLTREDLKQDGPYNTYTRPGLPVGPIANPGRAAIHAVLNPTPSEYLFYITGNDGVFYYAETLDQHNLNVARYLR